MVQPTRVRIYDDPKHPQYGPVRRLHVMLLQLFADRDMRVMDSLYQEQERYWDDDLVFLLARVEMSEPDAQRTIMKRILRDAH